MKIFEIFSDFSGFDCNIVFPYGEHESERFESFWSEFDRVLVEIHSQEGRGTQSSRYPQLQSGVENLFTGFYLPKSNRLCPKYSTIDYFLN